MRGGLKILNRLAQVPQGDMPGSAVLRVALLAAGTEIHLFFARETSLFLVQAQQPFFSLMYLYHCHQLLSLPAYRGLRASPDEFRVAKSLLPLCCYNG